METNSPSMITELERRNAIQGTLQDYDCSKCHNKGYIFIFKDDDFSTVKCECINIRSNIRRLRNSGLENVIHQFTFEKYIAKEEWQKNAKTLAELFKTGWFFMGGAVGAGKTHLCTAIIGKLLNEGKQCKYMMWRDEVTKLKSMVMDDEYSEKIGILKNINTLYIDDFFKTEKGTSPTSADINIAFEILNNRYINNMTTIISCEKTISEILDIDEAVGSRIYEKTKGTRVIIPRDTKKNWRLQQK